MEFRFDPNQDYQVDAVSAIADIFEGQPRLDGELRFSLDAAGSPAVANQLELTEVDLLANVQSVQKVNDLDADSELGVIEREVSTAAGDLKVRFPNFSVEMETGTGKTYVYIRTALELHQRYGFRKFMVIVPSVAIREGVLKTFQQTEHHFRNLYGNVPYRYYTYAADNISQVRGFALSDGIEFMVITIASFNKPTNVLRQAGTDRLQGETPIHLLQAARPVLILDEPQNMESDLSVESLSSLNPLFAMRYSATHRNPYNNVYRLTPYEAYRQLLVKRIEVASVLKEDAFAIPFIRLDSIKAQKSRVSARLAVQQLQRTGLVKEKVITVSPGTDLQEKSARDEYEGFVVEEINPGSGFVRFGNNVEVQTGEALGADREALFEEQIRYTIEEHFRKQARLRGKNIKVLSLFFIDKVSNYVPDDGLIRTLFETQFRDLQAKYPDWKDVDVTEVHSGYFSAKRRRTGDLEFLDDSGSAEEEKAAYDLIMRDKERLLSFETPVSFVFSHSALREGWDNPNVFQICTLNHTVSEARKRQEVGRGMRLPVDQDGERDADPREALTVVANESYEKYVSQLQTEIEEEYGEAGAPPKPGNARKKRVTRLQKKRVLSDEFKALWERISQKTRYAVQVDSDAVISDLVDKLDELEIKAPRVTITKAQVSVDTEDALQALQLSAAKTVKGLAGRYPVPNIVDLMSHLMENTSPPMHLTRKTLLELFLRLKNKEAALANPHEFATSAVRLLKQRLADELINGIQYSKVDDWYEMELFDEEVEAFEQYLVKAPHSVYDYAITDSDTERKFVEGLEKRDDVRVYAKLPNWFKVRTPIGEYNPDWALVMEDRDEHGQATGEPLLYLVRETKSTHDTQKLRPDERRKIECGMRHFEGALDEVSYRVVTSASELP